MTVGDLLCLQCPTPYIQRSCCVSTHPCCGSGEPALLIQQVHYAQFSLNEVQHVLVVNKLNVAPVNALSLILSLTGGGGRGQGKKGARAKK
jgi:hypothetical protein